MRLTEENPVFPKAPVAKRSGVEEGGFLNMPDDYYAVIMAGGSGTRLWPLSRKSRPKQLLKLLGDRTMYEVAVDRLAPLFSPDKILVVTSEEQAKAFQALRPQIPMENYLLEPEPRGTAPAVGLAAFHLRQCAPGGAMAVLTADHFIRDESGFRKILQVAREVARGDYLVTLGIQPKSPTTGYGYIERGEALGEFGGRRAYRVAHFIEKPEPGVADAIWNDERYSWNSGMFVWRVEAILREIRRQLPEAYSTLDQMVFSLSDRGVGWRVGSDGWSQLASQTVDYGIMEGAERVAVVPAGDLGWSDVGSWESLRELMGPDPEGNAFSAPDLITVETRGSVVRQERNGRRLVALLGVDDLVVIDTPDVLLVCARSRAQQVRELVAELQQLPDGERFL